MSSKISRRQFWRLPLTQVAKNLVHTEEEEPRPTIRPPGALPETEFLSACDRCQECVKACPHDAILLLGPDRGELEGTPFLLPEQDPCRWCPSWDCIDACPTGALRPDTPVPPIAKAELIQADCLLSQNILCDECIVRCPSHIRAVSLRGKHPVIDDDACTGCGLCARFCPAEPGAIRIHPLPE